MKIIKALNTNIVAAIVYAAVFYFLIILINLSVIPNPPVPFRPTAGFALAIAIVYGWKVLPVIFLGTFSVVFFNHIYVEEIEQIYKLALISCFAVCAQAYFSRFLLKRYVGLDNPLVDEKAILKFLLLAGPLSCWLLPGIYLLNESWLGFDLSGAEIIQASLNYSNRLPYS